MNESAKSRYLSALNLIGGLSAGALVMYLLDPKGGRTRRALMQDKGERGAHVASRFARIGAMDIFNRTRGVASRIRLALVRRPDIPDNVLEARVRARLGRYSSHPHAISVKAEAGKIFLGGLTLAHEAKRVIQSVRKTEGVADVIDHLERHKNANRISSLQGGRAKFGQRIGFMQSNWPPATRAVIGALGAALLIGGLRRRGPAGIIAALSGITASARAFTNMELRRLFGFGGLPAVRIHRTFNINAPVSAVYSFFSRFENFPRFLTDIRDVRVSEDGQRSRWIVEGPAGMAVVLDMNLTKQKENRSLAWRSASGASVRHVGLLKFEAPDEKRTTVHLDFSFSPPAGALGLLAAKLFGASPKSKLDEALSQIKTLLEKGPSRRQVVGLH